MTEEQKSRCDQLFALGMIRNGEGYGLCDFSVSRIELMFDSREEWENRIKDIKAEVERRKGTGKL